MDQETEAPIEALEPDDEPDDDDVLGDAVTGAYCATSIVGGGVS